MSQQLTIDELLNEKQQLSEFSCVFSQTLEDILNENDLSAHDEEDDYDDQDLFQEVNSNSQAQNPVRQSDSVQNILMADPLSAKLSVTNKSASSVSLVKTQTSILRRSARINDMQIKPELIDKNVTESILTNVSQTFETANKRAVGVGVPTCLWSTSSKYLAIGTGLSNIAVFEVGVRDFKLLQDKVKRGPVTSVSIGSDNKLLAAGYEDGVINIFDLTTLSLAKTIMPGGAEVPAKTNKQAIIKVMFWKQSNELLSVDSQGVVQLHSIQRYLWLSVTSKKLFNSNLKCHDVVTGKVEGGAPVLIFVCLDAAILVKLEPSLKILYKFQRPKDVSPQKVPNADIGTVRENGQLLVTVVVSWGHELYIYKRNTAARQQSETFKLDEVVRPADALMSVQFVAENILVVLDERNRFVVMDLRKAGTDSKGIMHICDSNRDITSQKYLMNKQGKQLKMNTNTVVKCCDAFKQIFFIAKDGVHRLRCHRWTQFIHYLLEKKEWLQMLKITLEIYRGRFNRFVEDVVVTPTTSKLMNQMSYVYIKTRLESLVERDLLTVRTGEEQLQQILDTTIEFNLELGSYEHLFGPIYQLVHHHYHVSNQFIACFGPFIEADLIKQFPNQALLKEVISFYAGHRVELADKLISSLPQQHIDYFSTVEICSNHKLYNSLVYVGQLYGDFVTALNTVVRECKYLSDQGYQEAKIQTYHYLLYQTIWNSTNSKTITGTPLTPQAHQKALRHILAWMLVAQNIQYLLEQNAQNYFNTLIHLLNHSDTVRIAHSELETIDLQTVVLQPLLDNIYRDQKNTNISHIRLLVKFIIGLREEWKPSTESILWALENLPPTDLVGTPELTEFVNRHHQLISSHHSYSKLLQKLPAQISLILYIQDKEYQKAVDLFLSQQKTVSKSVLFERLNIDFFSQCGDRLIKIDPDASAKFMIENFSSEQINQAVSRLDANCMSRFLIVRKLDKLDPHKQIQWAQENLSEYLKALAIYTSERRVLHELKLNRLDTLAAMRVVTQHKLKSCEAYLLRIDKEPHLAIPLYFEAYSNKFVSEFNCILKFKYTPGRDLAKLWADLEATLHEVPNPSQFWPALSNTILKPLLQPFSKKMELAAELQLLSQKNGIHRQFINTYFGILQSFLLEVARNPPGDLASFLQPYWSLFNRPFFRAIIEKVLSQGQNQKMRLSLSNKIYLSDIAQDFAESMYQKSRAISSTPTCYQCKSGFSKQQTQHLFNCGHSIHLGCAPSTGLRCIKCRNPDIKKALAANHRGGEVEWPSASKSRVPMSRTVALHEGCRFDPQEW